MATGTDTGVVTRPGDRPPSPRWGLNRRREPPIEVVVFIVGSASLGTEIAVARLIAPFYGASNLVWANTIAVVLVALSVGYWVGGRLADRWQTMASLAALITVAAALLGVVPFAAEPFLRLSGRAFSSLSIGIFAGSLASLLALVALPLLLVGAVTPWALRLKLANLGDAGRTAGRLSAIGTAGALVGTFAASLVLVPYAGTRQTFLIFALSLGLVAAPALPRRAAIVAVALILALLIPRGLIKPAAAGERVLYETETRYQYAQVVQTGDDTRYLELNEGQAEHSVYRPGTVLTGGYWDSLLTLPFAALGHAPRSMAVLGNAAGTVDRAYAQYFPATSIDAVEIDPALTQIGIRWFGLQPRPQLHLVTADARPFLRTTNHRYDTIVVDAYRQPYIPFYLTTTEFFALVRDHLEPGGVVIVNVGQPAGQHALEKVMAATMRRIFPTVLRDPVTSSNTMLLGSAGSVTPARLTSAAVPADLRDQGRAEAASLQAPLPGGQVYTDDKAPIEQLIDRSLFNYATTSTTDHR
ncbi:MAG: fused MFS/spermidine synthase [Actinomycetota bacterium]|nr:fused MFS/spermidine synthase [Actinomycetota bacterium]